MNQKNLEEMTITRTTLGWGAPDTWPVEFERDGQTWRLDHRTVAKDGDMQCAEYTAGGPDWLIVINE